MFSHEARHILAAAILAVGTLLAGPLCRAADDVRQVTTEKLPNVPGKSITAIVVNYAPGAKSVKHRHAGSVLAYVLSGERTRRPGRPESTRLARPSSSRRAASISSVRTPARRSPRACSPSSSPMTAPN